MAWVHRLLSKDLETMKGVCQNCGLVGLMYRTNAATGDIRCGIAIAKKYAKRNNVVITDEEAREISLRPFGECEICGQNKKLMTDHDHLSNKYRGRICLRCNIGLGMFQDSPDILVAAIRYLS
jgi:hypothetical protein